MPCDDITESLRLVLDGQDRLADYELIKRTCGRAVGERDLLATRLTGTPARELLELDGGDFADSLGIADDTELFLHLKHFFAIQAGIRALLGEVAAGVSDPVRVARVYTEGDAVAIEAEISIDVLTDQIKSCGKCKGCGAFSAKALAKA